MIPTHPACQCPALLANPSHGCRVTPTREVTVNGKPMWLCADCQIGADEYVADLKARGLPRPYWAREETPMTD